MDKKCIDIAVQCLRDEAQAIIDQINYLDGNFEAAANLILSCKGKLVVTGVGKSGHIGAKMAATLSSTGTPSFFMNPLDAYHGDLGVCGSDDIVLAISNSGQTDELLRILPYFHEKKIPIIGISNNPQSLLAQNSTVHITVPVKQEAEPLGLAPTTSTTTTLAMGDALACALMKARDFKAQDFARFHPGGSLGKRLLTKARNVMQKENLPVVLVLVENPPLAVDEVKRDAESSQNKFFTLSVKDIMTKAPVTISPDTKISVVEKIMQDRKIHAVLVVDETGRLLGIVDSFRTMI